MKNYILLLLMSLGAACVDTPDTKDMTFSPDLGADVSDMPTPDIEPDLGTDSPEDMPQDMPADIIEDITPDEVCIPDACPDAFCGEMSDGCGSTLVCGQDPATCEDQDQGACGTYEDGCGAVIDCGVCLCDVRGGNPSTPLQPSCGPCGLGALTCTPEGLPVCTLPDGGELPGLLEAVACQEIVYVDPIGGIDGAPGSREAPLKSLAFALTQARPLIVVRQADVTLTGPLTLRDGVSLVGGFDADWTFVPDAKTRIVTTSAAGPAIGAWARDIIKPTLLANISVQAPDAPPGESSIGMLASNASGLLILTSEILAGRGGSGGAGTRGQDGTAGGDGTPGSMGYAFPYRFEAVSCASIAACANQMRGQGGTNPSCSQGTQGGQGGHGGFAFSVAGQQGATSIGGGAGGASMAGSTGRSGSMPLGFPTPGASGAHGQAGLGSISTQGTWRPASASSGVSGGQGAHGGGGGGGGGGPIGPIEQAGPSGGGGGAGGCGGQGATGGQAGHASLGLLALRSPGLKVLDSKVAANVGGSGGDGAFGGAGGAGGMGGAGETRGYTSTAQTSTRTLPNTSGAGGQGAGGGQGGPSGGGAGGPSVALWCEQGAVTTDTDTSLRVGMGGQGGGAATPAQGRAPGGLFTVSQGCAP